MDVNKHHVSTSIEQEYIPDESNFIAVSIDKPQRDTTVFHLSVDEAQKIDSKDVALDSKVNCDICEHDSTKGIILHSSTFSKSATFHENKEVCEECVHDISSALSPKDNTLESELVKKSI